MNLPLVLAFLFFIGSLIGWVIELFYRRFVSHRKSKKWVNPGFLVGPYLPIYGCGLCVLYLLARLENPNSSLPLVLNKLLLFLVMAVAMTLIELIAGEIFICSMKIKLWDYSNEWGNFKGIICPKYSLFWGILGAIYYFLIDPYINNALAWLSRNLAFSFVIGLFFGIFIIDFCYSANILMIIRKFAKESKIVVKYENLRSQIRKHQEKIRKKQRFFLSMWTESHLGKWLRENVKRDNLKKKDTEKGEDNTEPDTKAENNQ